MLTTEQLTKIFLSSLRGYATEVYAFREFRSNAHTLYDQSGNLVLSLSPADVYVVAKNPTTFAQLVWLRAADYKLSHDLWLGRIRVCL